MNTLDDQSIGTSFLTLQEALSIITLNPEGTLFQIRCKLPELNADDEETN
jgi:hypothetical protein